jgi:hypothetical protein
MLLEVLGQLVYNLDLLSRVEVQDIEPITDFLFPVRIQHRLLIDILRYDISRVYIYSDAGVN